MKKIIIPVLMLLLVLGLFTACGCEHEYTSVVTKEATCAVEGEKTYTCSLCEDVYTEPIPKTDDHDFKETVTKVATCAEEGEKVKTCKICEKSETSSIAKTDDHKYTESITTPATCSSEGVKTHTCTVCNATKTSSIAKLSHNYTEKVTKAATCASAGTATKTCTGCGHSTTSTIAKTNNHSTGYGYCSVCGSLIKTLESKADAIFDHSKDGLDKLSDSLTSVKKALNSSRYSGTTTAITSLALANGNFKKAIDACGNHAEFKEAKAQLQAISTRITNTFSGTVSTYGDSRDLVTLQKIVNTMNAINPYLENLTEIFKVWDNY